MPPADLTISQSLNLSDDYVPSLQVLAETLDPDRHDQEHFIPEFPGPVLRATKLPDIRILRGLLRDGRFGATSLIVGPLNGPWESALVAAILLQLPSHAELLIEHGANIDGFPTWCFSAASSRFIRGRPNFMTLSAGNTLPVRETVLKKTGTHTATDSNVPFTEEELAKRRLGRSRFWAELDFPRTDYPTNNPISSIAACAKVGNKGLIESLVNGGADEAGWISQCDQVPPNPTSSYLAVDTPLHLAVENEDEEMSQYLLNRGHKPDLFPLALMTRALSAIMFTIAKQSPWLHGFDLLAPHSDLNLRTPLFGCHILHFAVATLNLSLLQHVLATVGSQVFSQNLTTALGHTLLHIACLPIDDSVLNMHSLPIFTSMHEFRNLGTTWSPLNLQPRAQSPGGPVPRGTARGTYSNRGRTFSRGGSYTDTTRFKHVTPEDQSSQRSVIHFLLDSLLDPGSEVSKQDVHGNTALHYLASYRDLDEALIEDLRTRAGAKKGLVGGENVKDQSKRVRDTDPWTSVYNRWGLTAGNLFESGLTSRQEWHKEFMPFWENTDNVSILGIKK